MREGGRSDEVGWTMVTGASSGIGAAFARELGRRGHRLLLTGRCRARLEVVAAQVPGSDTLVADLAHPDGLASAERAVAERPVELLVNNAGTGRAGRLAEQAPGDAAETIAVNLTAVASLSRAALPGMLGRRSGGIIAVSSSASLCPAPDAPVYAATKAALDHLCTSLRADAGRRGVVVTCVRPGYVRTPFHARHGAEPVDVPDDRWCTPEDVVAAAIAAHERGQAVVDVPRRRLIDRAWPYIAAVRRAHERA